MQAVEHCTKILKEEIRPQLFPNSKAKIPFQALHELVNAVMEEETGKILKYKDLLKHLKLGPDWQTSGANKFGRLAQGMGGSVKETDTIKFIKKKTYLTFDYVTYPMEVCLQS